MANGVNITPELAESWKADIERLEKEITERRCQISQIRGAIALHKQLLAYVRGDSSAEPETEELKLGDAIVALLKKRGLAMKPKAIAAGLKEVGYTKALTPYFYVAISRCLTSGRISKRDDGRYRCA